MRKILFSLTTLLLIIATGTAWAVDYWGGPPQGSWDRGGPSTTFEHWMFSEPDVFTPEYFENPGMPFIDFEGGFEYGEWECPPELDPRGFVTGWHCNDEAGGTIHIVVPNFPDPNMIKAIFMQMTSTKYPSDVQVQGQGGTGPYTSGTWQTGLPSIQWPGPAPFNGAWYTYNFGLWVRPNPESEIISITVPYCTVIDQIVIDTICSPDDTVAAEASSWGEIKALYR